VNSRTIETAAEAIAFLNTCGMQVICTLGGFIVRDAGTEEEGFEVTCDSTEELIAFGGQERDICVSLHREPSVGSRSLIYRRMSSSPVDGTFARPTDLAVGVQLVKNETEVLNKMKSTTQSQFMAFSVEEFIHAFRPDGLGHIRMEDDEGEEVFDIPFEEIVCDICNCEMVQPEGDPLKKVVFVLDGYALCEECRERIREDESPLHIQQVKGGGLKMADENYDNTETATLVPTKAGKGYKIVHNGLWFYTSKAALVDMVQGKTKACTFHTIKDEEVRTG
jgi:hypothetical protein